MQFYREVEREKLDVLDGVVSFENLLNLTSSVVKI